MQQQGREKSWLNIALPKGRLGDKAYKLLAGAGYSATEDYNDTRKLVVENPDACVRYFLVKPATLRFTSSTARQTSASSARTF